MVHEAKKVRPPGIKLLTLLLGSCGPYSSCARNFHQPSLLTSSLALTWPLALLDFTNIDQMDQILRVNQVICRVVTIYRTLFHNVSLLEVFLGQCALRDGHRSCNYMVWPLCQTSFRAQCCSWGLVTNPQSIIRQHCSLMLLYWASFFQLTDFGSQTPANVFTRKKSAGSW